MAGTIAGFYLDASCVFHGFLRARDGTITTFDAPGAVNGTSPSGINPAGAITGTYFDASFVGHGFLRARDGTFTTFDASRASTVPPSPASTQAGPSREPTLTRTAWPRLRARSRRHHHHVRCAGLNRHVRRRHQPGWRHHGRILRRKRRGSRLSADSVKKRSTMRPSIQVKKATSPSGFSSPRAFMAILLCTAVAGSMLTGTMLAVFRPEAPATVPNRTLTFADRVAYQRAIEEVYWRHRIWPRSRGERLDPKPSLDEIIPPAQLENKVMDYLRNSQALENYWQRPLTAEQLQAEMDRMAKHTKQPEMLHELFEALGTIPLSSLSAWLSRSCRSVW